MSVSANLQDTTYNSLLKTTAECMSWATVEGVSLSSLRIKLLQTEQAAEKAGLPLEDIRLALQLGEYQARFGAL